MRCALAGWLGFPLSTGQEDGLIYEAPPCANAWQIFYMRSFRFWTNSIQELVCLGSGVRFGSLTDWLLVQYEQFWVKYYQLQADNSGKFFDECDSLDRDMGAWSIV